MVTSECFISCISVLMIAPNLTLVHILPPAIEQFPSRGQLQHVWKFIGTKESVCIREEFNSHRIIGKSWNTNMAVVSLFWNNNMAAMTSCENAPQFDGTVPHYSSIEHITLPCNKIIYHNLPYLFSNSVSPNFYIKTQHCSFKSHVLLRSYRHIPCSSASTVFDAIAVKIGPTAPLRKPNAGTTE